MSLRPFALPGLTRAGIAIVAGITLIVIVLRVSIGISLSLADPKASLWWHPREARALRRLAEDGLRLDPTFPGSVAAEANARRSIDRQPLEAGAVRTLGLAAGLRADDARAAALLSLAERMSRRDPQTQAWLIERAVAANDVPGALRHFDLALRTSAEFRPILFPILCDAMSDRAILFPAARLFEASTSWTREFVNFCVDTPRARPALAQVLTMAPAARAEASPTAMAKLISALASNRDFTLSYRLYRAAIAARGEPSRPGMIALTSAVYPPFDWTFASEVDLLAQRSGDGIYLLAGPDRHGELARRAIVIPAGTYRLIASFSPGGAASGFVWSVTCAGSAPVLPMTIQGSGGTFTIGGECPAQWLRLLAPQIHAAGRPREGALLALRIVPASA